MYEDGSFHADGAASVSNYGTVEYQLKRSVRGTLHTSYLTVRDVTDYQEWEYETSCGVPAVLALGYGKALILADMEDCFVTINCLVGTNGGLTRTNLEELADSFDFTKLDPVTVPELTEVPDERQPLNPPASARTTARATYAAVLRDLLYSGILPDGTVADLLDGADLSRNQFALLDINFDGEEELILLYTTTCTAGQRGMVLSFDETYTGIAGPVCIRLDEYPMLTFYDNGFIAAGASHNQT